MVNDTTLPADRPDRTAVEVDTKPWRQLCDLIETRQRHDDAGMDARPLGLTPTDEEIREAAAEVVASAQPLDPAAVVAPWLATADAAFLLQLDQAARQALARDADADATYQVVWHAEVLVDGGGPQAAALLAHAAHAALSSRYRVVRGRVSYLVDLARPPGQQLVDVEVVDP
jgi:hypothetical protein